MTGAEWFATRPGGMNRYFESLYLAMRLRDEVDVSATAFGTPPSGGDAWPRRTASLPIRVAASQLRRPRPRPAIIDRHFALYGPPLAGPARAADASVIHFQGPWFAESLAAGQAGWKGGVKQRWERARYRGADAAVVLCEAFGKILTDEFGFPEERIAVIPPGVDLQRFTVHPHVGGGPPTVLCVRRLERRMGIDTLLDAWPEVLASWPDAQLSVVGDGTARTDLEALAAKWGIQQSVTFHGRVSDEQLSLHYRSAHLTVVPTRELEGFGLIALESLATGRPVVVTDVGGLPDSVKELDASLIVPPEDPERLAARLVRALEGDVPGPQDCRAHAESFSWEKVVDRHLALYQSVLT